MNIQQVHDNSKTRWFLFKTSINQFLRATCVMATRIDFNFLPPHEAVASASHSWYKQSWSQVKSVHLPWQNEYLMAYFRGCSCFTAQLSVRFLKWVCQIKCLFFVLCLRFYRLVYIKTLSLCSAMTKSLHRDLFISLIVIHPELLDVKQRYPSFCGKLLKQTSCNHYLNSFSQKTKLCGSRDIKDLEAPYHNGSFSWNWDSGSSWFLFFLCCSVECLMFKEWINLDMNYIVKKLNFGENIWN